MSEQTVSKSVQFIPQRIVEEIEEFFGEPSTIPELEHPVFKKVDKVEYIGGYRNRDGIWSDFKVNGVIIISLFDVDAKYWTWKSVEDDEKQKKAFGKRVKYVMQKTGVPWELAKMAVKMNPVNSYNPEHVANADALNFIEAVKEVLDWYRINHKDGMSIERYLRLSSYSLGYLTNKQILIIKEYWLSQQNA